MAVSSPAVAQQTEMTRAVHRAPSLRPAAYASKMRRISSRTRRNSARTSSGVPGVSGVVDVPVMPAHLPWKGRAGLFGVAADGNDGVNGRGEELREVLRVVGGGVNADFR